MAIVSASCKAEAARKDPGNYNLYFPALFLFYRCLYYCNYTYLTMTRQNRYNVFFPGQMNQLHKSWVHHLLQADKLNKVTLAHKRLYNMHKFASP